MPGTEEEENLTKDEQELLLHIARDTIESVLAKKGIPSVQTREKKKLSAHRGVFVSLHTYDQLRGCIGVFTPNKPLCQSVQEMAMAAAFEDPRFPPVTQEEMKDVDIEISVLSPLREVRTPEEVKVGTHGIYITKGLNRGVLLPQVATEYGWDRETFLDHTCLKAGLPSGTWRKEKVKIEVFTAQVFGEKEGRQ